MKTEEAISPMTFHCLAKRMSQAKIHIFIPIDSCSPNYEKFPIEISHRQNTSALLETNEESESLRRILTA
jgi:hypothetical protein